MKRPSMRALRRLELSLSVQEAEQVELLARAYGTSPTGAVRLAIRLASEMPGVVNTICRDSKRAK